MVFLLAIKAGLAAAASGADEILGREASGVSGVLVGQGFFGADVTIVGIDLGVEVDRPVLGVWFCTLGDFDLVLNMVGVRPVSRKTSEIERG